MMRAAYTIAAAVLDSPAVRFEARRAWWTLWVALAACWPWPARAATLRWTAPEGCPTEAEVQSRVTADAAADLTAYPDVSIDARVVRAADGFRLNLSIERNQGAQERRIEAKSCGELVDALVAALTLAFDAIESERAEARESESPPAEDASPPMPAEPARSERVSGSGGAPALHGALGTGVVIDAGALPDTAFGWEGSFGLRLERVGLWLAAGILPEQRADLPSDTSGDFSLLYGGLGVCYEPAASVLRLRPCAAGRIGSLRGAGHDVRNPREQDALWATVGPDLWLVASPAPSGLRVYARAGLAIAVARRAFAVETVGVVHEPAALQGRFGAGVELELW